MRAVFPVSLERNFQRFLIYFLFGASVLLFAFFGMNALGSFYKDVWAHFDEIIRVLFLRGLPRVVLEGFSSLPFSLAVYALSPVLPFLCSALIVLIIGIAAYAVRSRPYFKEFILFAGYVIIAMTLLSVTRLPLHDYMTFAEQGFRYFYVQKYVLLFFSFICLYQFIAPCSRRVKVLLTVAAFVPVISFAAREQYRFVIAESITHAEYQKRIQSSSEVKTLRAVGMRLDKCLDSTGHIIEAMEKEHKAMNVDVCFVCHVQE